MQAQKQRSEPRADVELEVQYRTAQEFTAAYAKNISGGGIFIKTPQPLPLNRDVQIRFTLPGIPRKFVLQGLVVWSNPHPSRSSFPPGMGIKFMDLDPEVKTIIAKFVTERLPAATPEQNPGA
jgi:type IV pilus assembly protein PilZ